MSIGPPLASIAASKEWVCFHNESLGNGSITVVVDHGLSKGLRSFLRKVVADAARDRSVRIKAPRALSSLLASRSRLVKPFRWGSRTSSGDLLLEIVSDAGTACLFPGRENKRHMLVAGHDAWRRRGSQPRLLDAEVGQATQYLLKQGSEFEPNHIGGHAAVAA